MSSVKPVPREAPRSGWRGLKRRLRPWLLKAGGVRRIHIVGCARSGTTMLHYSMIAFDGTLLVDRETSVVGCPTLRESFSLFGHGVLGRSPVHVVTKRDFGWFHADQIEQLVECTLRERIGIINVVRDPRDVLTSRHLGAEGARFYVEPDRWRASIEAADHLFARLAEYPDKLTVRYEDVVRSPKTAEAVLLERFGLGLRANIDSMARLKDNLAAFDAKTEMALYMQKVRNYDPGTIGRWRTAPESAARVEQLLNASPIRDALRAFMRRYDYAS